LRKLGLKFGTVYQFWLFMRVPCRVINVWTFTIRVCFIVICFFRMSKYTWQLKRRSAVYIDVKRWKSNEVLKFKFELCVLTGADTNNDNPKQFN
jgi:hypothetical protein